MRNVFLFFLFVFKIIGIVWCLQTFIRLLESEFLFFSYNFFLHVTIQCHERTYAFGLLRLFIQEGRLFVRNCLYFQESWFDDWCETSRAEKSSHFELCVAQL